MQKIWKDIAGYEGLYRVSNFGEVESLPRLGTRSNQPLLMRQTKSPKGYLNVCLTKNRKKWTVRVHRLVAEAFVPNTANLPQINHKDENKQNNRADNLEWCDCKYNNCYNDRMRTIAHKNGKRVRCLETGTVYYSISEAARATGVTYSNIWNVCQGKQKRARGYHFNYEDY